MAGEIFDQKRGLNKQEERDFLKKGDIDKIKQEVGGDVKKLESTIIKNYHSENYDNISGDKINQIKTVVGKDFYDKNYKLKSGGSEGIAALQILAIKCVGVLNQVSVEQILKTKYISSWSVDGILGPNTLYMLKEISKTDLGGPAITEWNGIINQELLNKMLNICGEKQEEPEKQEKQEKQEEPEKQEKQEEPEKQEKQEENDSGLDEKRDIVRGLDNNGSGSDDYFRKKAQELEQKINDVMKPDLKKQIDNLALKYSADGYTFDKNIKKSLNGEREFYSVIKNGVVVMDIGIFVSGADKGKMYIGLGEYIYQKSNVGQELNFNAFDQKSKFENIINEIQNKQKVEVVRSEFTLQSLKNGLRENTFAPYGLTYEMIFNKVNAIKNQEVKDKICEYLLKSDIKGMQEYVGMKQGSKYKDNNADGNFGKITLDRISNPLFGLKGNDIESSGEIVGDVKSKYKEFLEKNLNLGLSFAIISKSDFNMYVFSADHKLISVHPVVLGKDRGDQANTAYVKGNRVKTTPGGMYYIPEDINNLGNKAAKLAPDKYAYPGEYVALYPEENQYAVSNPDDFTLGFHNYYLGKNRDGVRENLFWEPDLNKRRISSGCINTLPQGSIYDNLIWKSKVYITKESN